MRLRPEPARRANKSLGGVEVVDSRSDVVVQVWGGAAYEEQACVDDGHEQGDGFRYLVGVLSNAEDF